MPMLLVAFYRKKYSNLFIMMCTQMAFKQTTKSILDFLIPILFTKRKLRRLEAQYAEAIEFYRSQSDLGHHD